MGGINLELNNVIIILGCIICMLIVGVVFKVSMFKILKLIFNSLLGVCLIYFINLVGVSINLHIGLNVVTTIFVGILGIPGAILLILLKLF